MSSFKRRRKEKEKADFSAMMFDSDNENVVSINSHHTDSLKV